MSLVLALKNLFPAKADNEWLMEQYRLTQEARYIELLYTECGDDLYHYILSQTDRQLAQEVCQLTWLRVIERRNSYRSSGKFKGWLFAIARNLLIDELRRLQRWQYEDDAQLVQPETGDLNAGTRSLSEALQRLPFHQREAIVLQQEGFSLQEIAAIAGEETETIKSRLRYGKSKLKKIWRVEHV